MRVRVRAQGVLQTEVKQIMKKRTAFETALVRRIAKKNDFLRYIAYEMSLETLRKKRVERLSESYRMSSSVRFDATIHYKSCSVRHPQFQIMLS